MSFTEYNLEKNNKLIIQSPETRDELKQLIKQNKNKLVYIKFYGEWCNPCKEIHNRVEDIFYSINTHNKLMIYVDVDKQQDVASYFKIRKLPTLISFKDGERHNIMTGTNEKNLEHFFVNM